VLTHGIELNALMIKGDNLMNRNVMNIMLIMLAVIGSIALSV